MKRHCTTIGSCLLVLTFCLPAFTQEAEPGEERQEEKAGEAEGAAAESPSAPVPSDEALKATSSDVAPTTPILTTGPRGGEERQIWKDIVVLPRKSFLKGGRIELMPYFATTVNDNLIQHFALGGELNYFLTDILSIGISGMYYFKNVLEEEFRTRYHFERVPTLNQYKYTATLNFAYVPLYGKFAIFNNQILHFEVFLTAGVGGTGTEIIPRDYNNEGFTNPFSLTFPVGAGARLFLTRWLAVQVGFRDYMMLDKFESSPRIAGLSAEKAKEEGETRFVNNILFNMGVGFFFPMDFKYTTFR